MSDSPHPPPQPDQPAPPRADATSIVRRLGPAGILGLFWSIAPAIMGGTLLVNLRSIAPWLTDRGEAGVFIYAGLFMLLAGIGVLPTYAQSVLGGWVFGVAVGLPAAMAGFVGGSVLGYGISRLASRERVQRIIDEKPKARAIRDALIGHGYWKTLGVVTLIRLNSPFSLTNLVMASVKVPLMAYVPGTALGLLPRTAACVILASISADKAGSIEESAKGPPWWLIVAGIVVTLIVLAVIGHIAAKAVQGIKPSNTSGSTSGG